MDYEQVGQHIRQGTLLIIGNRPKIIEMSLEKGCAILVTGGYMPSDSIKAIADKKNLPLIVTPHDTFSVTHLINRVTNDQIIKRDIIAVDSIYIKAERLYTINLNSNVKDRYD